MGKKTEKLMAKTARLMRANGCDMMILAKVSLPKGVAERLVITPVSGTRRVSPRTGRKSSGLS